MATINDIANWFLNQQPLTHKQLQKLTYYTYAWGLALYHDKMIEDARFEAWVHGPVSPTLYNMYKSHGWNLIPTTESHYDFNEKELELLNSVWITYKDKSGNELEALTHTEMPWLKARLGLSENENSNQVISDADMEEYYSSIYAGE